VTAKKSLAERRIALGASIGMVARAANMGVIQAGYGESGEGHSDYAMVTERVRAVIEAWEKDGAPEPTAGDLRDIAVERTERGYMEAEGKRAQAPYDRFREERKALDAASKKRMDAINASIQAEAKLRHAMITEMKAIRERMGLSQREMAMLIGLDENRLGNAENFRTTYAVRVLEDQLDRYRLAEKMRAS
jgi:DNA-binding transcriptional regulator YiaG